uniref:C2 and GRAM domain-containing protein n=1 Tax=Oryza meridionalis TaxID=40149 RepID=A0A0E0EMN4_9ORYZ
MRLNVRVIEARNLRAMDSNGFSDPYVKLQLGKQRFKTKVVKKNLNPAWDQEFSFSVGDVRDVLKLYVYDEDMIGIDDFLGQVKVPLEDVLAADNYSLGARWFQLLPKGKTDKAIDCGEICVAMSLETAGATRSWSDDLVSELTDIQKDYSLSSQGTGTSVALSYQGSEACQEESVNGNLGRAGFTEEDNCSQDTDKNQTTAEDKSNGIPAAASAGIEVSRTDKSNKPSFVDRVCQMFVRKSDDVVTTPLVTTDKSEDVQEATTGYEAPATGSQTYSASTDTPFDELLKYFESKHQEVEMPVDLQGILVDKSYITSPSDLNNFLFSPDSNFRQTVVELQGCSDVKMESWKIDSDGESLKRVITYTTAPSKLVKAVKATEEQSYLKADGNGYSVLLSVSTPDVPCGTYFRTEILFRILPGPELDSEQLTTHLVISWRINFLQSTMMKGMIENGAKQGLQQNYAQFSDLLSQKIKPIDVDAGSDKGQVLASLRRGQESDWKIAFLYFCNFGVLCSLFVTIYIAVHVQLKSSGAHKGLEFPGLDLPDSLSEIVMGGLLFLQLQHIYKKISCFIQAREQKVGDHGVKAQGDGWLLTVALIEGTKLAPVDATGFSDPYVVFTCNGKSKTSSIKFQTLEPQWNDIFEFDAMDDPPSVMNVHVYDFDGPFDEVTSLGHAEINFVKSNLSELADVWIPLQGNLAQSWQSKLHLRIFLSNSKGSTMVTEYLSKMEKEVGKKMTLRSPRTNTAFQELFSLPAEEFLISSFTCCLKRKLHTQGHLFLSPRTIGFYSSMFGRKTKFFFLWEDIEEIQAVPQSISSWSPSLVITLHKGRGMDAKHGAKSVDNGRLKFCLQSFASFSVANRTIMALWKARSLSSEYKMQIAEEQSQNNDTLQSEDSGIFVGVEDAKNLQMNEVFSSSISANMASLMEVFGGGSFEMKIMNKVGCLNYSATQWESDKPDEYQRQIHYKFSRKLSPIGGEVTGTQQKSPMPNKSGWIIEEVMELQGILFGDFFTIHIRYQIEDLAPKQRACSVQVFLGIEWSKTTRHRKRIEKSVLSGEICVAMSLETAGATRSWSDDLVSELTDIQKDYSLSSQGTGTSVALSYQGSEACQEESVNGNLGRAGFTEEDNCSQDTDKNQTTAEDKSNGIPAAASAGIEVSRTDKSNKPSFVDRVCQMFVRKSDDVVTTPLVTTDKSEDVQEATTGYEAPATGSQTYSASTDTPFDELLKYFESKHQEVEMPVDLQGILVDKSYITSPSDLNNFLFSPDSNFRQTVVELQGCSDVKMESWKIDSDGESLKRVITYTTAPSKLVKAVKATEEQSYLKADGNGYSVLLSVSTPDVPCGTYFRTEILFRILPGPELDSEQLTTHLSTMMKGMIENGAKQGLQQNYAQFSDLLSQKIKPIDVDAGSDKGQVLASLRRGQESDWKIAFLYFCNFGVLCSLFVTIYIAVHVQLKSSGAHKGLEFPGLDLPDSLSEIVMGGLLFLQLQHIYKKISCFIQAREQKVGDHGVKAQGDGWLLTVALIEGTKLAPVDATGFSDPYVVFTCNGKSKTSSIKFQTLEPQWNDIFEFDAMDDPPSVMNVHVYDFDGPFDEVTSLGHAEINFVKSNLSELADVWIPLQGNLAQSWQSKLHLRIFLSNSKGSTMVTEYLSKMEKEVGKKMTLRSPRTNTAFQELFSLPAEEFLISSFTCCLKRKLHTQGHLFLSPRTIGFYSSMFGRKTKFFFLWEDIEEIQAVPQSISSWSPSLVITLHKGRGMDAKHGAKSVDNGRLKFCLQSFASFSVANRTIMALWKARSLSSEYKMQIAEEQSQNNDTLQSEDSGIFVGVEDAKNLQMNEVFSSSISANMASLMEVFGGGSFEMKIMNKVGCLNYSATQWESDKPDEYQRQIHYKFSRKLSPIGGEVTGTQQKSPMPNKSGWIIEEVMELQGILFGDFFTIHIRYQIEDLAPKQRACSVQVFLGIEWSKTTRHRKRIEKSVLSGSSARLKEMFILASKQLPHAR